MCPDVLGCRHYCECPGQSLSLRSFTTTPIFLSSFHSQIRPSGLVFSTVNVRALSFLVSSDVVYSRYAVTLCPTVDGAALHRRIIQSVSLSLTARNSFFSVLCPSCHESWSYRIWSSPFIVRDISDLGRRSSSGWNLSQLEKSAMKTTILIIYICFISMAVN